MSRVTYTTTPATADQETLRMVHRVRLVTESEEGTGVATLPGGVYGFTYSPALPNAPLFRERRYRSYETHKLANGEVLVIGFTTKDVAQQLSSGQAEVTVQLQPEPEMPADTLVALPYSRMRQHRQYAAPNQRGVTVTIVPGTGGANPSRLGQVGSLCDPTSQCLDRYTAPNENFVLVAWHAARPARRHERAGAV